MASRIADWYSDAEGRGEERPSHDWRDDDQADRTPESWLDHHAAAAPPASRRGSVQRPQPPRQAVPVVVPVPTFRGPTTDGLRKPSSGEPSKKKRKPKPPSVGLRWLDVAIAVRELRAARPNDRDYELLAALKQRGGLWTKITQEIVREALSRERGEAAGGATEAGAQGVTRSQPVSRAWHQDVAWRIGTPPPAPRLSEPDRPVCAACGVAYGDSGLCRCS